MVSVWRADPGSESGAAPDESLPRLSNEDAARVADYLDAGAVVARTTARIADVWSDDSAACVPLTQRTDGVWRWDDAVSYFVRHYNLSPGTEFLDYLRERDFTLPPITAAQVAAVTDEVFGARGAPTPDRPVRLDGTQLLPCEYYCVYQGRVFLYAHVRDETQIELQALPGQAPPDGFRPAQARPGIAYKVVLKSEVSAYYKVITACQYKGDPYSIRRIDGPRLWLTLGGGRRVKRTVPEPPSPTLDELGDFPNAEVIGPSEAWATIDILEAARVTMAIVPYHLVDDYLKPVRDLTGAGYSVPAAEDIFYYPSPVDSPYLPPAQAVAAVGEYLAAHDPTYPADALSPVRLRDGWEMTTTHAVDTVYCVADDNHVVYAPAAMPVAQVSNRLSAEFRQRHPVVDPPPAHDTGTDIFD